ncbi:hypothetical protein GMOD_00003072 [Pyrenophora seminiperda CCB06]|uniref:Uncharacterized protein n=1 Tax=Pyrenophora seminiperda CCB06 TaxID=1302712 RepID=A0A3M7M3R4_9PLEO|nr:hypothetical protein GMOD_00003072 [Pyrenophora seminiperda CCB06]
MSKAKVTSGQVELCDSQPSVVGTEGCTIATPKTGTCILTAWLRLASTFKQGEVGSGERAQDQGCYKTHDNSQQHFKYTQTLWTTFSISAIHQPFEQHQLHIRSDSEQHLLQVISPISTMYFTSIIVTLLSALHVTFSAPATSLQARDDPYQCGYVLTELNSSAFAGLSEYSTCTPIYYNESIPGYQDAFAYSVYGGCQCHFFESETECDEATNCQTFEGPTPGEPGTEPCFDEPKPKWYTCARV